MKTKILIVVVLLSFISVPIFGQNNNEALDLNNNNYKYSLGFGAGITTGYGLSFRYIPNKFGVQANFAPYTRSQLIQLSVGASFIYNFHQTKYVSFYLYQGNHLQYTSNTNGETYVFNNGVGAGIEFNILNRIGLNIMGGYAFYDNFGGLNFSVESGLYYRF